MSIKDGAIEGNNPLDILSGAKGFADAEDSFNFPYQTSGAGYICHFPDMVLLMPIISFDVCHTRAEFMSGKWTKRYTGEIVVASVDKDLMGGRFIKVNPEDVEQYLANAIAEAKSFYSENRPQVWTKE